MSGSLQGRHALVTGGSKGIGRAIAAELTAAGARVTVLGRDRGSLEMVVASAEADGYVLADVTDEASLRAALETAGERSGPIDLLVANAGGVETAPFLKTGADSFRRMVDLNLFGIVNAVQAVLPGMRRLGGGRIVIVTSEWGVTGWPRATAYAASQAGLIGLTKTLGRELAPEGIIVNAVAPGVIDTPQLEVDADDAGISLAEMHQRYAADIPVGRIGRPDEIADTVAFLASPDAGAFVGQTLQINGGTTRCRV